MLNPWNNVNAIANVASKYYLCGDGGLISSSIDRRSWSGCDSNAVFSLFALDGAPGLIFAGGNGLMRALDGFHFTQLTNLPKWTDANGIAHFLTVYSVKVVSPTEAYIGCSYGYVLHTVDGGATWGILDQKSPASLIFAICVLNPTTILTATIDATIMKTVDGGVTWAKKNSLAGIPLRDLKISPTGVGFACGDSGLLFKTADFGETWTRIYLPSLNTTSPDNFRKIALLSNTELYIAGLDGIVIHSQDGGQNWVNVSNMQSNWVATVFESPTVGVIGGGKVTAATDDGGSIWIMTNGASIVTVSAATFSALPPPTAAPAPTTTTTSKKKA